MSIRVAISIGDYNGIGPEVVLKSLQNTNIEYRSSTPIVVGSDKIVAYYNQYLEKPIEYTTIDSDDDIVEGKINVYNCCEESEIDIRPGNLSPKAGTCAMLAVEKSVELCMDGKADALVTGSISKEAVNEAGYDITGHTEFLADMTGADDFIMMMINENTRVGLLTIHIPLKEVIEHIKQEKITRYIKILNRCLKTDFDIDNPTVAVLGLNPHAGDGGHIGEEELEEITPAINEARAEDIAAEGPFPADGFFGSRKYNQFDGILAMYHDQGLIPFKTLTFGGGVNFTAGLPIIRTSPDHGTAFDIAGRARANPASFQQAFELAINLAEKRNLNK